MPLLAAGCLDAGVGVVIVGWRGCGDARGQKSRAQTWGCSEVVVDVEFRTK
jgi:hypothetical protein